MAKMWKVAFAVTCLAPISSFASCPCTVVTPNATMGSSHIYISNLTDATTAVDSGYPFGTSGASIGVLNGSNTYSGNDIFSGNDQFTGGVEIGSPTGGMPGAGALNAQSISLNNVPLQNFSYAINVKEFGAYGDGTSHQISAAEAASGKCPTAQAGDEWDWYAVCKIIYLYQYTGSAFGHFPVWSSAKTSLSGGSTATVSSSTPAYFPCNGYRAGAGTTALSPNTVPYAMTLKNFYALLSGNPGTGLSFFFTVYVNGSSTSISATCTSGTTCSDTTHTASISAGQSCAVQVTTSATATAQVPSWALEGDNP